MQKALGSIGTGKNGAWKKESLVPYVLSSAHYSRAPAMQVTTQVTLLLLELVFQPYIMYNQGMFTKWLHATHILKIWSVFPRISEHLGAYWKGYFYPRGEGWGVVIQKREFKFSFNKLNFSPVWVLIPARIENLDNSCKRITHD